MGHETETTVNLEHQQASSDLVPKVSTDPNSAAPSATIGQPGASSGGGVRKREPRLIHCKDGVISEDEVGRIFDEFDEPLPKTVGKWTEGMVPAKCTWPKWFAFYSVFIFVNIIIVCEYLGEKLARFFGIMDSKYTYILDEHLRNLKRQKEIEDALEMEPEIELTSVHEINDQVIIRPQNTD